MKPTMPSAIVLGLLTIVACSSSPSAGRADAAAAGSGGTIADASAMGGSGGASADASASGSPDAGSGASDAVPTVMSPLSLAALPAAFAKVVCFQYLGCCTSDERACGQLPDDPGTCEPAATTEEGVLADRAMKSIAAKRTSYDGAAMAACLQKLASAACTEARMALVFAANFCSAFTPMVAKGGACQNDFECIDSYCADPAVDKDGVCTALKPNGTDCLFNDECMSGFCSEADAACGAAPGGLCL